jgi:uncharacterized membrane protein
MASAKDLFNDAEKDAIVAAIRKVEIHTSGEIRVHIDDRCDEDAYDRAVKVFHFLKMDKTAFRNGVLIYIAVKDRKFSIIGDEAIYNKIDNNFWSAISQKLHNEFIENNFAAGVINAIESVGETLIKYFPDVDELDRNELPNDISYE